MAERVDLAAMQPRLEAASTRYCLASEDGESIVFVPGGGAVTVKLPTSEAQFSVGWIDPVEGTIVGTGEVRGGGAQTLQSPHPGDVALHLWPR